MPEPVTSRVCPNCASIRDTPRDACVLEAMGSVLVQRGEDPKRVMALLRTVDVDEFWKDVGNLVDALQLRLASRP